MAPNFGSITRDKPTTSRPFTEELNERLANLEKNMQETMQIIFNVNGNLFGPQPAVGEAVCVDPSKNCGVTGLILGRLSDIESLARLIGDEVTKFRQIG